MAVAYLPTEDLWEWGSGERRTDDSPHNSRRTVQGGSLRHGTEMAILLPLLAFSDSSDRPATLGD